VIKRRLQRGSEGAAWTASPQLARPAVPCQHDSDLCRYVARPLVDVEPPITKRMLAADYRGIVPSHVEEPGGITVHATIEMHDHAEPE
jgi:hypothetical protein